MPGCRNRSTLEPNAVYRLRFQARRLQGTTGLPGEWPGILQSGSRVVGERVDGHRVVLHDTRSSFLTRSTRLRFGQWEVNGTVAFDDVRRGAA